MSGTDDLPQRWKDLLEKYVSGNCTREELAELLHLVKKEDNPGELSLILRTYWERSKPLPAEPQTDIDLKFSLLMEQAKKEEAEMVPPPSRSWRFRLRWAAAAMVIGLACTTTWLLWRPTLHTHTVRTAAVHPKPPEIFPSHDKAVLTLANGSTILLDSTQNGTITTQGTTKVLQRNGALAYDKQRNPASTLLYNSVSTPKGGQYRLVLADGTKVWLNAASSLRFPTAFPDSARRIELTGEAYFEVAKNRRAPFTVQVNNMAVTVLGTHFNLNSYDDESMIRTTLLEGSVRISGRHASATIRPGEQAQFDRSESIVILPGADLEEAVAWKDGQFRFARADIYAIMRQLQRWYDIDVKYAGTIPSHFVGAIPRTVPLSQVLSMLQLTGRIRFDIQNTTITVRPA